MANNEVIGVCYGLDHDDSITREEAIARCLRFGLTKIRIYKPDEGVLKALANTGIKVILGVPNEYIPLLARSIADATAWVDSYVTPYIDTVDFWCIAVGNFIHVPPKEILSKLFPAIQNIYTAICSAGPKKKIKISVEINTSFLAEFKDPSHATFCQKLTVDMEPVIDYLVSISGDKSTVILANVYPYFAHTNDPNKFTLPFALFTGADARYDPYVNLYDYQLAAISYALTNYKGNIFEFYVSETGWPSDGDSNVSTNSNAGTYYQNLIHHVVEEKPDYMPVKPKEVYLFSLLDENQKGPHAIDKHFGIFYTSLKKYLNVPKDPDTDDKDRHFGINFASLMKKKNPNVPKK